MNLSVLALLALSLTAFAGDRNHECPRAGEVLSVRELAESGDEKIATHDREGIAAIESEAILKGVIKTNIHKNFEDKLCVAKTYTQTERFCEGISADIALGKGNAYFKAIYDLERNLLQRAEAFAKGVKYFTSQPETERLEIATNIVKALTASAAQAGIPRGWESLVASLQEAAKTSAVTFQVVEEITVTYASENKSVLGFVPMTGIEIQEGKGNGKLNKIFNLDLSPSMRASKIMELIIGVNSEESMKLGKSFIEFAGQNGIPTSWDQFGLMMKSAMNTGVISAMTHEKVMVVMENENRRAMGFEITAQVCKNREVKKIQNKIELSIRQVFSREIVKSYEVKITGAPLVKGEKEKISIAYNGIKSPELKIVSEYNKHSIISQVEQMGITKINVQGTRMLVTPPNGLKATFNMQGDQPIVSLQNGAYDAKVGGKVIVKVRYINEQIFGDKEIGVEMYELMGSEVINPKVVTKNKKIDTIRISVQISGTPYYSTTFSQELRVKPRR